MTQQSPDSGGIIGWFARNRIAANLLMASVMVMGFMALMNLRTETFPSLEPNRVTISVTYKTGDAKASEEGVGIKIEEALETVQGIKHITTTSTATGSTVVVEKLDDYPLETLWDDIKTEVDSINDLPDDAEVPVLEKATRQEHAITVELYGDSDRSELQPLAKQLKTSLLALSEVHDLELSSEQDPVIYVDIDEKKLQALGLSFTEVSSTINAESSSALTTSLRNPDKTVRLKVAQQRYTPAEFGNIVIKSTTDGSRIHLKDIATITEGFDEDSFVLSRFNGQNAIGIEILMNDQSNITRVVPQVNRLVEEWRNSGILPSQVHITTWDDSSTMITSRLQLLADNALTGIIFVFVILALFLNLHVAFWVAMGLPFIFLGTAYMMSDTWFNLSLNSMTTFGFIMALGIVVDDAVVIGESVFTTRRRHGDTTDNTVKGVMKVAVPTVFGVLTTVATFVAISNVSGRMGEVYSQFATVVTVCLLFSLLESKIILLAHLAHLNTTHKPAGNWWNRIQHGADSALAWFSNQLYRPAIEFALNYRYAVVLLFVAIFLLVIDMPFNGTLRTTFFPDIPGDRITGTFNMYQDASYGQTKRNLLEMEAKARTTEQVLRKRFAMEADAPIIKALQATAGSDSAGTVKITFAENIPFSSTDFTREWQHEVGMLPGAKDVKFVSHRDMGDNFRAEIKGWNEATVTAAARAFEERLAEETGVSGVQDNLNNTQAQYRFELTPAGQALGLETSSLSSQIYRAFGGYVTQSFQRGKDDFDVKVRFPAKQRQTLADVLATKISLEDGTTVPLSSVAKVSFVQQQTSVTRIDGLRAAYVTAVVDKEKQSPSEVVNTLRLTLVPELMKKYPDLKIQFTGEAEHQEETTGSMKSMFIMAMLAIYALLAVPLKSYVQPVIIMTAIPFGIVGALLGHWFNGLAVSILSLNGIIALSGVVVNDSLLLVSTYNELRRDEGLSVHDAVVTACTGRLRAVFLTSLTTFAGLAPLLGETDLQAQFLIPAAASLGYGILFATVITLVLIPSLLKIYEEVAGIAGRVVGRAA